MPCIPSRWTRRDFLTRLRLAGGSAALYQAMIVLGLVLAPPAHAGPARLPGHHQAVPSCCRELGVALQPLINDNRSAFPHSSTAFGARPSADSRSARTASTPTAAASSPRCWPRPSAAAPWTTA